MASYKITVHPLAFTNDEGQSYKLVNRIPRVGLLSDWHSLYIILYSSLHDLTFQVFYDRPKTPPFTTSHPKFAMVVFTCSESLSLIAIFNQ